MQVQILSRRPISTPCPLTSPGDPPLKRAMRVRFPSRRPVFCRVVQSRTVRLIHGIALDERQDRERYPARQPVPVRRSERRADLVSRTRPVRPRRRAPISPFIVQETGREPAKLEIEVQVLVRGPLFSSRGEITIMRRFERRVAGGSPAARSTPRGRAVQASAF